ncbi:MAG: class I SAM-dependent methyltransferase [Bacteroidota bacterium]
MQINQVFDEMSDGYTGKITRWVPYYQQLISSISTNLPTNFKPYRILDLGCGNGNVTQLLHKRFPEAHFTLLDASEEMIGICQRRFSIVKNIEYRIGFFQEVDFEAASFDLIAAGLSLHHLRSEEKRAFFPRLHRWLRKGGQFTFSDLLIDKDDEPGHSEHLQLWEHYARERGTTSEEWAYIMDHYDTYDHPDGINKQLKWLAEAGFDQAQCTWQERWWCNVRAEKGA